MSGTFEVNMNERPRQSGKTSYLKCRVLEDMGKDRCMVSTFVYVTMNHNQAKEIQRFFDMLGLNVYVVSGSSFINSIRDSFRGCSGHTFKVYMDEPFFIDYKVQADILDFMRSEVQRRGNTFKVFGLGTKPECTRSDRFEDFL